MKVLATASLMVLALFSGCTSGAFAPTSTTEGAPASLEEPPSSATPAAEPSPIGSIAPSAFALTPASIYPTDLHR